MSKFTMGFVTGTVVWFLASVYTAKHVYMSGAVQDKNVQMRK